MTEPLVFRLATRDDAPGLRALLLAAALPVDDLSLDDQEYVLALSAGRLVGSAGLEVHGDVGLVRSLAVAAEGRRQGLGAVLCERVEALALLRGVRTAYALTTTAERFLLGRGYERVPRAEVPAGVAGTAQFRSLCPATAVCLRRRLGAS